MAGACQKASIQAPARLSGNLSGYWYVYQGYNELPYLTAPSIVYFSPDTLYEAPGSTGWIDSTNLAPYGTFTERFPMPTISFQPVDGTPRLEISSQNGTYICSIVKL